MAYSQKADNKRPVVVISQPMFFPWPGIFEQIQLADIFIHYDNAQFPMGRSFISRVQIKTQHGIKWLTVPVVRKGKQLIRNVLIDKKQEWWKKHLRTLEGSYAKAPFFDDMFNLVEKIFQHSFEYLNDLNIMSIEKTCEYFGLETEFKLSSDFPFETKGSEKILDLVSSVNGYRYITGHGAKNYLDHELLEHNDITVEYMAYRCIPYPQIHGTFTPYVSILDLMANCGKDGRKYISSGTIDWRTFIKNPEKKRE
jgi:hypothetical protein